MDLAAFVVLHAVTVLLDRSSYPDLEIFRIFEEAIGLLVSNHHASPLTFRSPSQARACHGATMLMALFRPNA